MRRVIARKTTLDRLDDRFDAEFWAGVPAEARLVEAWRLSEEVYRLAGKDPGESGLPRSTARVVRR